MKQKKQLLGIITTVCLCLVFTSCRKDEKIAMKLSGKWTGYWGMYYRDDTGKEYDSDHSVVQFIPNEKYDTQGTGYQVDYYTDPDSPYETISYYFTWNVLKKDIYITYPNNPGLSMQIKDYKLKKDHFYGHFPNSTTEFDLHAIEKVYKWSDYARLNLYDGVAFLCWLSDLADCVPYYYYDDYYHGYHWATRSIDGSDSEDNNQSIKAIQIGNRFAEE